MADYNLFIGGEFMAAQEGAVFDSIDPSSGQTLATVAKAGKPTPSVRSPPRGRPSTTGAGRA